MGGSIRGQDGNTLVAVVLEVVSQTFDTLSELEVGSLVISSCGRPVHQCLGIGLNHRCARQEKGGIELMVIRNWCDMLGMLRQIALFQRGSWHRGQLIEQLIKTVHRRHRFSIEYGVTKF